MLKNNKLEQKKRKKKKKKDNLTGMQQIHIYANLEIYIYDNYVGNVYKLFFLTDIIY